MTKFQFIPHRPKKNDPGDVPFRIRGMKLKWLAPHQTEGGSNSEWRILRPESLPKEVLDELTKYNPDIFGSSNTIRRKDLILGFMSDEKAVAIRQEKQAEARSRMDSIRPTNMSRGVSKTAVTVKEAFLSKEAPGGASDFLKD